MADYNDNDKGDNNIRNNMSYLFKRIYSLKYSMIVKQHGASSKS